jgi:short-subunit dehydrogenase
VVNICSILGKLSVPRQGAYTATKHAMVAITDTIRQELHKSGVEFTIVNPGYIDTGMFEGAKVPLITHWQDPQKVADAVVDAVKKNKAEIFVPRLMLLISILTRAIHTKLIDLNFRIFGADKTFDTMKKDRGRPF